MGRSFVLIIRKAVLVFNKLNLAWVACSYIKIWLNRHLLKFLSKLVLSFDYSLYTFDLIAAKWNDLYEEIWTKNNTGTISIIIRTWCKCYFSVKKSTEASSRYLNDSKRGAGWANTACQSILLTITIAVDNPFDVMDTRIVYTYYWIRDLVSLALFTRSYSITTACLF